MNKIQILAKEMKSFFSPGTVTDVYMICKLLGIEVIEAPIKADAYLKCENGRSYIVLKESLSYKRKKFTIAHELGHFYIPWHAELMFGCDISEMDYKRDYIPREKEANIFAAELLMPEEDFRKRLTEKICYKLILDLAKVFDVSFQASLNRCIDLADEDCIAICSENNHIKWFRATEEFPLYLNKKKVCPLSGAADLCNISAFGVKTIVEPGYVWFDNADDLYIEEEGIKFPKYNEVISIIHLKDEL
ncbi:MAG: ImmA/IrrE family metallo-endopeptidase [Lachnospiraceae bacterium]|nr:ImmA/IrrE family metallo-endopeptidase [Lachnospiraceae bacterium]